MKKVFIISLATIAFLVAGVLVFFRHFFIYEVDGNSMNPTLKNRESVLSREFALKDIERGDIIGFAPSDFAEDEFLKRVVGLPGDTVEIKNEQVLVNGKKAPYPINAKGAPDFGPVHVKKDRLFVLGDLLSVSEDSRDFGVISYEQVRGVLVFK